MINENKDELKKSCEKMDLEYMVYFTAWNFSDAMEAVNQLITGYGEEEDQQETKIGVMKAQWLLGIVHNFVEVLSERLEEELIEE